MKTISAALLFLSTVIVISTMWLPDFWVFALAEITGFLLAAAWLTAGTAGKQSLRLNIVLIPLAGAVLWCALQLIAGVTVYRWATETALLYWAGNGCIVFTALQIFADFRIRHLYLRALLIAGLALSILAPLQFYTSSGKIFWLFPSAYQSVMGPFLSPNQYAAFSELILAIAVYGVFTERGGWRILHALATPLIYASVIAASSRAGFILCSLELVVIPILALRRTGLRLRDVQIPAGIFLGMLTVLVLAAGPDRLLAKLEVKNPYAGRAEYSEAGLKMIAARPLFGFGLGTWQVAYPSYELFDDGLTVNQAHNDWVQWTAEGGIPFGVMMLVIAVWSFPRALRSGWGTGIACVYLHCFVDYPIQRMGVAMVFFSLIGMLASRETSDATATVRA